MNNLEKLVDLIWFPRVNTTGVEGNESFVLGLFCELNFDIHNDGKYIVDAVRHYWDAFVEGSTEAGVNLMRILIKTQYNLYKSGQVAFQDKIEIISERLASIGHPIMPYYDALSAILISKATDTKWDKMFELAANENPYAATLCGLIPLMEENKEDE